MKEGRDVWRIILVILVGMALGVGVVSSEPAACSQCPPLRGETAWLRLQSVTVNGIQVGRPASYEDYEFLVFAEGDNYAGQQVLQLEVLASGGGPLIFVERYYEDR